MTSLRNYSPAHPAVLAEPVTPAEIPPEITEDSPAEIVEHELADAGPLPYNAVTGVAYRGGNIMRLLTVEVERGYGGGGWAGFGQWASIGRRPLKNTGVRCITVVTVTGDEGKTRTKPRGFTVHHYDATRPMTDAEVAEYKASKTKDAE